MVTTVQRRWGDKYISILQIVMLKATLAEIAKASFFLIRLSFLHLDLVFTLSTDTFWLNQTKTKQRHNLGTNQTKTKQRHNFKLLQGFVQMKVSDSMTTFKGELLFNSRWALIVLIVENHCRVTAKRLTKYLSFTGCEWNKSAHCDEYQGSTERDKTFDRIYDNGHRRRLFSVGEKSQSTAQKMCVLVGNRLPSRRSDQPESLSFSIRVSFDESTWRRNNVWIILWIPVVPTGRGICFVRKWWREKRR